MDDLISKQDKQAVVNLIDNMNAISFYEANEHSKECYYEIRNAILAMPEQEPILDKITAEIEQIADEEQKHDEKWAIGLRYAVNIIDKYMAESEDRHES